MSIFLAALGFGLVTAAVLSVSAVGITLQFAVTDVLNLAFGGVMIVSAYAAYAVNMSGASVWVGLVVAMVVGALLSVALNRFIYTPFQRRGTSPIAVVIVSLGMTLILEFGLQAFVGGDSVSYSLNPGPTLDLLGLQLSIVQLILILIAVATMLAIHSLLRYSRLGKAMRATAANRSLARNSGIRTERVVTITWLISGALAGLGGTVFAIDSGSFGATSTDLLLVSHPLRGLPRRSRTGIWRDVGSLDHRRRNRGERCLHLAPIQGCRRFHPAVRHARVATYRAARRPRTL